MSQNGPKFLDTAILEKMVYFIWQWWTWQTTGIALLHYLFWYRQAYYSIIMDERPA